MLDNPSQKIFPLISEIKKKIPELLSHRHIFEYKKDLSIVTKSDLLIQEFLIKLFKSKYPNDNFIVEENSDEITHKLSDFYWIIDPIDGSQNFKDGKKEYSISIGLMYKSEFIESYIYFPEYDIELYALKEHGVLFNNKQLARNTYDSDNKSIILCSKTIKILKSNFILSGFKVDYYRCATYSMLQVLLEKCIFYHTINTMLYDVGPMALVLSEHGFNNYDNQLKPIEFHTNLEKIPFFLCINSNYQLTPNDKKNLSIERQT